MITDSQISDILDSIRDDVIVALREGPFNVSDKNIIRKNPAKQYLASGLPKIFVFMRGFQERPEGGPLNETPYLLNVGIDIFEKENDGSSLYTPAIERAVRGNDRRFPLMKETDGSITDPAQYSSTTARAVDIVNFQGLRDPYDSNQGSFVVQLSFDTLFYA